MTENKKRTWHKPTAYVLRGVYSNSGNTPAGIENVKSFQWSTEVTSSFGGYRPS